MVKNLGDETDGEGIDRPHVVIVIVFGTRPISAVNRSHRRVYTCPATKRHVSQTVGDEVGLPDSEQGPR
ncbi:hypothetical protein, partial [Nonomuraea guangzhouensis]